MRHPYEPPFHNNLSKYTGDAPDIISKNRKRFFGLLGIDESRLAHASQIHSANIQLVNKPGLYTDTDAFITNTEGLFLVISVADCIPVMIYDPVNEAIANIHSGWRGTQQNIVCKTVELMTVNFKSKPDELIVFMGPGISKKNFEVDKDVACLFSCEYVAPKPGVKEKYLVDTGKMIYNSLLAAGVKELNIERNGLCTLDNEYLHSYRRDKNKSGRMFAVIGIKEK